VGVGDPMVNVRMPPDLIERVQASAEASRLGRSTWCREVLRAVAESHVSLAELCARLAEPAPESLPDQVATFAVTGELGPTRHLTGRCLHPVHARLRYPTREVCAACGETVMRR
jgi:hypothetical protein